MLITYFDEVKPNAPDQPYYWVGGLMVEDNYIAHLEKELKTLAVRCFGARSGLTKQTEFHATDVASGCGNFKKWRNPGDRFQVLKDLIRIYDKPEGVYRVAIRIDISKLYAGTDCEQMALMHLVERVDQFARAKRATAMLIGDFEKEKAVNRAVQNLARYREDGTPYAFGREITQLVDTIHFAHSHHSRPLQLADTYMWSQQLRHRTSEQSELRHNGAALIPAKLPQ